MQWFLSLNFIFQVLVIYLVLINLVTFFYFGIDKLKAQFSKRRISEKQLWFLTLIGGTLGALAGMHFFRHKTKKSSFQGVILLILLVHIGLLYFFFRISLFS